jgi:hypothetical protein
VFEYEDAQGGYDLVVMNFFLNVFDRKSANRILDHVHAKLVKIGASRFLCLCVLVGWRLNGWSWQGVYISGLSFVCHLTYQHHPTHTHKTPNDTTTQAARWRSGTGPAPTGTSPSAPS